MKNVILLLASLSIIIVLSIGLSSCKDDDPFVKPNLSVSDDALTVPEAGGTIEVEVVLDKGAPEDITIEYDLSGTALSPADYTIVGKEGEVEIAKGETSAVIKIQIVSDALYEGNETIQISLEDVDSDDVVITNDDEAVITITDDDPQIIASFATSTMTVNEADGLIEVSVTLSQPAVGNVSIQYLLTGTARDSVTARAAEPDLPLDYAIRGGTPGVLQIASGQTTGIIKFGLYSDFVIEDGVPSTAAWDPETMIITLAQASGGVLISSTNDEMVIKIAQEDGKVIALFWDDGTTIDMDLVLWIGEEVTSLEDVIALSIAIDTEGPEVVFIPDVITDAAFGASYIYYSGSVTPMTFESHFIDFVDGALGDRDVYTGTYTSANLNEWEAFDDIQIEQTFEKVDGDFVNVSSITTPTTGSRIRTYKIPVGTQKTKSSPYNLKKF